MKVHNIFRVLFIGFIVSFLCMSCKKADYVSRDWPNDNPSEETDSSSEEVSNVINYATFNIEYDNRKNTTNLWENRKFLVKDIFDKYDFDIVTVDEAYYSQLADMESLIPGYTYYGSNVQGTTADKILTVGILYKTDRFEIKKSGRFWLSSTPNVPSKSFAGHQYRICNWAFFEDKKLGTEFYVFATHNSLSRYGEKEQWDAVSLIINRIQSIAAGYPVILSGDFNSTQYTDIYTKIAEGGVLTDSYLLAESHETPYQGTYNGYNISYATDRIDYVFVAHCNNFKIKSQRVITDAAGGKFASDHYPVLVKLVIPKNCSTSPVKDTITEDFKYAVIQSDYLTNEKEVTPSGLWTFNGASLPKDASQGDYRGMAPRLKGKTSTADAGYIQNNFPLKGLKEVKVNFVSMASGVTGTEFKLGVEISTDKGRTWVSAGNATTAKGQKKTAVFTPDIPSDKNVLVRLVNESENEGNLENGNQINILSVSFILP